MNCGFQKIRGQVDDVSVCAVHRFDSLLRVYIYIYIFFFFICFSSLPFMCQISLPFLVTSPISIRFACRLFLLECRATILT